MASRARSIESNHLDEKFHDALCRIGSKVADLARNDPGFFHQFLPPVPK